MEPYKLLKKAFQGLLLVLSVMAVIIALTGCSAGEAAQEVENDNKTSPLNIFTPVNINELSDYDKFLAEAETKGGGEMWCSVRDIDGEPDDFIIIKGAGFYNQGYRDYQFLYVDDNGELQYGLANECYNFEWTE